MRLDSRVELGPYEDVLRGKTRDFFTLKVRRCLDKCNIPTPTPAGLTSGLDFILNESRFETDDYHRVKNASIEKSETPFAKGNLRSRRLVECRSINNSKP